MSTNQESRLTEDAESFVVGLMYDFSFMRQFIEHERKVDPKAAEAHSRRLDEIEEEYALQEEKEGEETKR